ncbi:MAG: dihydrolipoyl dehydrogenase [Pseudomonadales bacterium]|nr:dihydrolipoyl dehydrogenase [Pseudomonadales bacterium]MCP5215145.1 dihydrolipoyl dehydrogenase [Pseudomonadales bacterium]
MTRRTKVLILGAGTAGLTALKEAQRYTDDIMLVNAGPYGTTCARVGCMPSKALLEVAHAVGRRDWLAQVGVGGTDALAVDLPMVMAHVRVLRDRFIAGPIELAKSLGECSIHGKATFLDPHTVDVEGVRIQAETIIIATGTRPFVPDSWRAFGSRVVTSDEVFELKAPKRRVGVVGLGPIGLELGQAFAQLGCEVHAFTRGPHVAGLRDEEVNASLVEVLTKQMTVITEADVSLHEGGDHIIVEGGNHRAEVDWVLASLGRRPNIEGLGLECLGVELDSRGMPVFDAATLRVGDLPIYIAGDVNGQRPLLHEAADEGRIAAYHALHPEAECLSRRAPLGIVFTEPGVGHAGQTSRALDEAGVDFVTGSTRFNKQGRALTAGRNYGTLKVYADAHDGRLLGVEMVAPDAEHMTQLLAWSIQQRLTLDQLLQMPFYHPTVEEGLRSALQSARRELGKRRTQPDLPLCHDRVDWALG